MTVALIWAQAANGVIGDQGRLPWHLPEDLHRFRELTMGSPVVMGRTTWESLPDAVRPLPGRRNVVLSRRAGWQAEGATVAGSLDAALAAHRTSYDVWVIGGASVYRAALPRADRLEITELARDFAGDTYAPAIGPAWAASRREPASGWLQSRTGLTYRTVTYLRVAADVHAGPAADGE